MSPGQMGAHCECAARAASTESASMCVLRIMKEGVNEFMQRYNFSVPFGRVLKECQRLVCLPSPLQPNGKELLTQVVRTQTGGQTLSRQWFLLGYARQGEPAQL